MSIKYTFYVGSTLLLISTFSTWLLPFIFAAVQLATWHFQLL